MAELEKDRRVDFIREYTLTSMRLKQDKVIRSNLLHWLTEELYVSSGTRSSSRTSRGTTSCPSWTRLSLSRWSSPRTSPVISRSDSAAMNLRPYKSRLVCLDPHRLAESDEKQRSFLREKGEESYTRGKYWYCRVFGHRRRISQCPWYDKFIISFYIFFCSLDHLCSWVEEVLVPIFNNEENMKKFPKCVAYGI